MKIKIIPEVLDLDAKTGVNGVEKGKPIQSQNDGLTNPTSDVKPQPLAHIMLHPAPNTVHPAPD